MNVALDMTESLSVMVVEDEPLIAWMLEDTVSEMGHVVTGPYPSLEEAEASLRRGLPDIALLDVNLTDGEVYPLADRLAENGVPIIFHTANLKREDLESRYAGSRLVPKPSTPSELKSALDGAKEDLLSNLSSG